VDNSGLQNLFKRLSKIMWESNVTDPITYVTQIAYLLFLKILEETDQENAGTQLLSQVEINGEKVDLTPLQWTVLTSDPDNERMLRTLRDLLPMLGTHPNLSPAAKSIFFDARVLIPDGQTLRRLVDQITVMHFLSQDADVKGDLFEYLSSELGQQKKSAQFRTPRHLVRLIVEMVNPQIGGTICDSACGTGGFLIAAYEHIILKNTSEEFVRLVDTPGNQVVKRGVGDNLSQTQWDFLRKNSIHGFDGEQTFVRMTAMNALLHGFDYSTVLRRDSIGGNEDKWDEVQFDYILENPPFSGAAQSPKKSLRLEKGSKYLLFLAGAIRSLKKGGRAGIILPSGILFGDTSSHNEVKQRLLAECDLQAVIILPKGMFEPYTPNETCVLVFEKTGKMSKDVWFYKMDGDGSSLKKARKFGPQFRNDFPDLLLKWPGRDIEEGRSWLVPASKIIENNYNMTLTGLGLLVPEIEVFPPAEELILEIDAHNQKVTELVKFIQKSLIK